MVNLQIPECCVNYNYCQIRALHYFWSPRVSDVQEQLYQHILCNFICLQYVFDKDNSLNIFVWKIKILPPWNCRFKRQILYSDLQCSYYGFHFDKVKCQKLLLNIQCRTIVGPLKLLLTYQEYFHRYWWEKLVHMIEYASKMFCKTC